MPKLSTIRLTQKFCSEALASSSSAKTYRCCEVRGLGLKVSPPGRKVFIFSYSIEGREKRLTIGQFGPWTLAGAKKRASELRREVDQGRDPLGEKVAAKSAPTFANVWGWYRDHFFAGLSESHKRDLKASWERTIIPYFGANTKLQQLSKAEIQAFLDKVSKDRGKVTANRSHSYLRSVLAKAENDGWIDSNPAAGGIRRNSEHGRERYLSEREFGELTKALERRRGEASADAIAIMMFTGARKTQTLKMRWADINFEAGLWIAPSSSTKNQKPHRVQLNSIAHAILRQRFKSAGSNEFVFPSCSATGRLQEVRKTWGSLKREAQITNCRLHDLRHTFASFLVSDGKTLELIGAMLGHSQMQTTKRYAHLQDAPLKEAAESIIKFAD
ncbi:site-specific integrase [Pontixanthobacter sp. CEM42]|uniref:tyrosine-type recombinase/integrase n=1 Tax=Pontixanthobacter sp. CEM42 TaxID=2792077 RepID=UPI001ADEF247|nr:site-specific integrase [Pontixanthobacter sp. CEM42]